MEHEINEMKNFKNNFAISKFEYHLQIPKVKQRQKCENQHKAHKEILGRKTPIYENEIM